jgi:UDP-N-acetylglucosamine--N-acetylmuramyl-(pentapeptide) pyrophosphoryl-undecaprenol N-acetylglucosamine transferase
LSDKVSDVLWVGGEGGMEADLVTRQGITFAAIPAAGVHGVGLRALPGNLARLTRGTLASRRLLRSFRPDVLFFTGGYVAVPMAVAGWRVPTLLYVPDIEPGLALQALARFADRIAVTAEASRRFFPKPGLVTVTGYPTRPGLLSWTRAEARRHFNLTDDKPVLLVTGGSKGARSINQAVLANRDALLNRVQVIHLTGGLDWPGVEALAGQLPAHQKANYRAFPYLHDDMGAALAAADLVLSRAGASTLGEYPLFGLPAILVPYPYAWRYQKVNADYLVQRGAAAMLEDAQLMDTLLPTVQALVENPGKLEAMRAAMRGLAAPQAADAIGAQLLALAGKS